MYTYTDKIFSYRQLTRNLQNLKQMNLSSANESEKLANKVGDRVKDTDTTDSIMKIKKYHI